VASAHRVLRLLLRARRLGAAEVTASLSEILGSHWDAAEASLIRVALRYNEEFARSLETDPPVMSENKGRDSRRDVG
jgi:hypothetical protein